MKSLTFYVILLACLAAAAQNVIPSAIAPLGRVGMGAKWTPLSLNPVAWYQGDGDALDSSGKGNHGAWSGTAAYTAAVVGSGFDIGLDRYIYSADNLVYGTMTVSAWVKTPVVFDRVQYLVSNFGAAAAGSYILRVKEDGTANWYVLTDGGTINLISAKLSTNAWYHVCGVIKSGQSALFVNGVSVGMSATAYTTVSITAYPFNIGHRASSILDVFKSNVLIDDVLIFDYALTLEQISELYTKSKAQNGAKWEVKP